MSLWRYKGEKFEKLYNFIFHTGFQTLKCVKTAFDPHYITAGTFLCNVAQFQLSMSNSSQAPASILKNARKRPFLYGRGDSIARGSSFAMNDILYARPISSLSNGVYLMSLRPSVAEQSARDPSGVGPFFAVSDFSISNVKPMEHASTR